MYYQKPNDYVECGLPVDIDIERSIDNLVTLLNQSNQSTFMKKNKESLKIIFDNENYFDTFKHSIYKRSMQERRHTHYNSMLFALIDIIGKYPRVPRYNAFTYTLYETVQKNKGIWI